MAPKTKAIKYIKKEDITNSISVLSVSEKTQLWLDDLRKLFTPTSKKTKSKSTKTDEPSEEKPKTRKSKKASDEPPAEPVKKTRAKSTKSSKSISETPSKPLDLSDHSFKVGDPVYCWYKEDKLYGKVVELLPHSSYKIEWTDFSKIKGHPFVFNCPFKYVGQTVIHSALEIETKPIKD